MKTEIMDNALKTFTLKTQEGVVLNEILTQGQKEIGECILTRRAPDGKQKIHTMAHTRYGKSMIVGATVAIRASMKGEKWAIVAPTKEQAQIIMDYVIWFAVNDPIISATLKTNPKAIKNESLTQRRSRDHITFFQGGEVRTYSAGQTMGQGAQNVILDEAGLINDDDEDKIFRMLGDNPTDFFIMKIGNPFHNNHFKDAYLDDSYYHFNIDATQGLREGRLSQEILDEQKKKPNYQCLYWNVFPDAESVDRYGFLPLISHKTLENAQVEEGALVPLGTKILGCDPADSGDNEAVIVNRNSNFAKIEVADATMDSGALADQVILRKDQIDYIYWDKQGVGTGEARRMEKASDIKRKFRSINSGLPIKPEDAKGEDVSDYYNLRAYMFWKTKLWLEAGGKLTKDKRWKNLLAVKYKTKNGKVLVISKEDLRTKYKVKDLGVADALSYTFYPTPPTNFQNVVQDNRAEDPIKPFYPEFGI